MKIVAIESLCVSPKITESIASELFKLGHEFIHYNDKILNQVILTDRSFNADIIITVTTPISTQFIQASTNLKLIAVAFTGYEHIDLNTCKEKGIQVCNVP